MERLLLSGFGFVHLPSRHILTVHSSGAQPNQHFRAFLVFCERAQSAALKHIGVDSAESET